MLARWLPLAQGYGRVACRTSKARASRAAWSPSPAHARSRSVRAHAAGGWRISDNLGSGGGGSGGNDERPPGDEGSFRDGTREGREREGRGRARAPSRGYDARPRDAYDSHPRGRSRGGRDDLRHHDPGFSSRDSSRDSSSSSREFGGRGRAGRAGRAGRGGRGGARGGRGRGDRGGRGRGARASFRDDFRDESFYGVKRGGDGRRDERDERRGGSDFSAAAFAGDASRASHDQTRPFHNADPSKRNDTGQNDWDCGACGADNFARRDVCFRCGAERGAVETGRRAVSNRASRDARDARFDTARRAFETRAPKPNNDSFKQRRDAGGGGDRWDVSREGVGWAESDGGSERAPIPAGCSRFYATCHPGLEEVVAAELRAFPIEALDVRAGASGVYFVGTKKTGVLANVWLRSAVRVLVELRHGWLDSSAPGGAAVYDFVRYAVPWPEVVPERTRSTFSFESRVWSCTDVTSTRLAVTRAKDAVCDALVDANGWRPPPPARGHASADVPMFLSLYRDEATLYRDMSGESLHRRGYRDAAIHRAALNESAAAGVLALAGWADACDKARRSTGADPQNEYALPVLVDPMCGSGTLLIEAALTAGMVAPGLVRADAARRRSARGGGFEAEGSEFEDDGRGGFVERRDANSDVAYAFERWPDHDRAVLDEVLAEAEAIGAEARRRGAKPVLIGNDRHGGALGLARRAAIAAGVDGMISFTQGDCGDLTHPALDAAREAEVAYFDARLKDDSDDVSEKYGEGFVDLDALGPVTTRPGGGGVLVVSNPPWGKRLDVGGGGRDADGQRRSAKRWGARERGGDGYGEEEADAFFLDADAATRGAVAASDAREEDSVGGHSSLETFGEEDDDETQSAWQSLGVFFRRECAGATAHLLSGDAGATRPLRMRAKKKRVLGIGGVDCRLLEYRVLPPKREKNLADLVHEAREEEAENGFRV